MPLKLKEEHSLTCVGFNGKSTPLGERTDLHVLVDIAHMSGDESLLQYFEEYPTVEELRDAKEANFLKNTEKYIEPKAETLND